MRSTPNEGQRPSLLQLGRFAAGELTEPERADLEASLDPASRAVLSEMEALKGEMPPLDLGALRARASALPEQDAPGPANNAWGFFGLRTLGPLLAVAAALLLALLLVLAPEDKPDLRFRASPDTLQVYHLGPKGGVPYAQGVAVGENDLLGFEVAADGHSGVVLLSVDGNGTVSVFYPKEGDAPEPLQGSGLVKLPGSVILDGAPGPEIFLAVFDKTVSEARSEVMRTFQSGSHEGLLEWARSAPGVDAVPITRR